MLMKEFLNAKIEERAKAINFAGRKKGIGVVGLHEGRTLALALSTRTNYAYPVAGCDVSEKKIAETRRDVPNLFFTTNYAEMLARPDVDIVAIYTPDSLHGEHIRQAFEAGKDVICTKPLINSMTAAKMILQAARRTGRKLLVGQSTRFFEPFRRQRRAYDSGELGELELIDVHYIHRMDWFYEKSPWAATETDWVFLGMSHPLDLVCWYLGHVKEVNAYGYRSSLGVKYGLQGKDIYIVNLVSDTGKIARAMGHYGLRELPSVRNAIELILYGSTNTSFAQYHDMKYRYTKSDGTEVCEDPLYEMRHYYFNSEVHGMHYGEFANYTDYFAEALINGKQFSPSLEEGIETFCVMEAVRRSAGSGKPVDVRLLLTEAGLTVD
jgi:predicted dehydrogenase